MNTYLKGYLSKIAEYSLGLPIDESKDRTSPARYEGGTPPGFGTPLRVTSTTQDWSPPPKEDFDPNKPWRKVNIAPPDDLPSYFYRLEDKYERRIPGIHTAHKPGEEYPQRLQRNIISSNYPDASAGSWPYTFMSEGAPPSRVHQAELSGFLKNLPEKQKQQPVSPGMSVQDIRRRDMQEAWNRQLEDGTFTSFDDAKASMLNKGYSEQEIRPLIESEAVRESRRRRLVEDYDKLRSEKGMYEVFDALQELGYSEEEMNELLNAITQGRMMVQTPSIGSSIG